MPSDAIQPADDASRGAPVSTRRASAADLAAVRALYEEGGYAGGIGLDDVVIVAMVGDVPVGAVRLCREHGETVLRGMQVRTDYRRRGAGRALLAACVPLLEPAATYCLPYAHLVDFYGMAGFRVIDAVELPGFLCERLAAYRAGGQDVLAMKRDAPRAERSELSNTLSI